jgi:CHAD domain-containing protein
MTEDALLTHKIENLHEDVGEMRSAIGRLTDAVTKLALLEERQSQAAAALERAFGVLERVEARLHSLEMQLPQARRVNIWIDRAVYACVGVLFMLVLKKSGIV